MIFYWENKELRRIPVYTKSFFYACFFLAQPRYEQNIRNTFPFRSAVHFIAWSAVRLHGGITTNTPQDNKPPLPNVTRPSTT
jgi:hypothetical protein